MPRDVNGVYTLPSGNPVVPNTTVSSTWANITMQDIATALTASLSVPGSVTPDHLNANAAGFRTKLGLSSAAITNIGTSGATIPLCNGANTWAAAQAFSSTVNITGALTTGSTATFGATVTVQTGALNVTNGQSTLAKATQTITDWATAGVLINGAPDAMIAFQVPGLRAGALGITGDGELSWKNNADGTNYYKVWTAKNFNPATKQDALGFTPVRQGGVASGSASTVNIGWRVDGTLGLKVDATEFGNSWPINITGSAGSLGSVGAGSYMRKDTAQVFTGSELKLDNGTGDAPQIRWQTYGAGAMTIDMDCVGAVFRAYVNGGAGFPFQFDCGAGTFTSFGQTVLRADNWSTFTATSNLGDVGSYTTAAVASGGPYSPGQAVAGSSLRYSGSGGAAGGTIGVGTWRVMGNANGTFGALRIS